MPPTLRHILLADGGSDQNCRNVPAPRASVAGRERPAPLDTPSARQTLAHLVMHKLETYLQLAIQASRTPDCPGGWRCDDTSVIPSTWHPSRRDLPLSLPLSGERDANYAKLIFND